MEIENGPRSCPGFRSRVTRRPIGRIRHTALTHWGRATRWCIYASVILTTIGSDNGLSPCRRRASIWTNAGMILIGPLGTNFSEILIEILTFSFKKMCLMKASSATPRPFCLGLNVLITHPCHPFNISNGMNESLNPIKRDAIAYPCPDFSQTVGARNKTSTVWLLLSIVHMSYFDFLTLRGIVCPGRWILDITTTGWTCCCLAGEDWTHYQHKFPVYWLKFHWSVLWRVYDMPVVIYIRARRRTEAKQFIERLMTQFTKAWRRYQFSMV